MSEEVEPPNVWEGRRVTAVLDGWRVVDRWWTDAPLERHYFEIELERDAHVVIYREDGVWRAHETGRR